MVATVVLCVIIVAVLVLSVFHYRKNLRSGCCGSDSDSAPKKIKVQDRDLSHYPYEKVLNINGMTCSNCATHVQNALNSLGGVYSKVDLDRKQAVVYMKENLSDPVLRKAIADAGYMVESVQPALQ